MITPTLLLENEYKDLFERYITSQFVFPLIAAVIERKQDGLIFVNCNESPTSYFIVHKFGFCQFFEVESDIRFERQICDFLDSTNNLAGICGEKLRIYCTDKKWSGYIDSLNNPSFAKTTRCRMHFGGIIPSPNLSESKVCEISESNFHLLEQSINLSYGQRFWKSNQEFLSSSGAVATFIDDVAVSVCYSAATSNCMAEIDVYTHEDYRHGGHALDALNVFIRQSILVGVKPYWDCYKNNIASFKLALSAGFFVKYEYDFYVVDFR
ncbi:GNAT family N-acetyltransferase [Enterovibrio makurazakiensis]|uniref:GNAT family N-acetyltransferase n=1 Tax=Enterovibrio makurazakiensis TaxID=2910232 RepID=UPI003D2635FD